MKSGGKYQEYDLKCSKIDIIGPANRDLLPINEKLKSTLDWTKLRQIIHLRPRAEKVAALFRIRSKLVTEIYRFMEQQEYYNVTTPIITSNDCEGGGDTFKISDANSFFGKDVYLTVSSQLHLEAMASAMSKVFTLSPAFRAENSQTRRHLAEFSMLEAEEYFLDSLDDLMDRVELLVKHLTTFVSEKCFDDMDSLTMSDSKSRYAKNIEKLLWKKYIRLTYEEAIDIINKTQKIEVVNIGDDIGRHHEKFLLDYFEGIPIFITHYPTSLKPFYMKEEDGKALCFDLIVRTGGELCGGSLREDSLEILTNRLALLGRMDSLKWLA